MKRSARTRLFFSLLFSAFLMGLLLLQTGCANIIPPEGGSRDSLPPVLLRSAPENGTRNFGTDRIVLSFDEYVELNNYQQNLIVSPLPANPPSVTRKLNTITIKMRDSLEPNTTYTFDFGESIKDLNEGNLMKDFTYIFSTGRQIDSLEVGGRVILAETGGIDSTLTIMLYRTGEDSALTDISQRPRYIAKTDSKGSFVFRHLPPGTFYLYALQSSGGGYRYTDTTKLFAFADSAIVAGQTTPVTLYAYATKPGAPGSSSPTGGTRNNNNRATATVEKRLRFATNLNAGRQGLTQRLIFTFETPLKNFDSSKVHFSTDSTFTPVAGAYSWSLDSAGKNLTLRHAWQENKPYHLVLEKDFATDTLGQQLLKADTLSFTTKARTDYGKISIRFRNLDLSRHPVLLFVQSEQVVASYPLTGSQFAEELFEPGEYSLRILDDANQNGKWDPGRFFGTRRQPELVHPVGRKLTVRPNWDNLFELAL
ncbi:MAG: Ig-like domain-containing domain [Chitinophagaceae bacterium]